MFPIYFLDRFLKPTANIWKVITIKLQDTEIFALTPCCYFASYKNTSTRFSYFLPPPRDLLPYDTAGSYSNCHHHHVPEGLGMLSCSLILKMKLVPPSLPRSSYVSSSFWFIWQCLFWQSVSILCTCCSHFFWYCFISFTMFFAPVFCLIH